MNRHRAGEEECKNDVKIRPFVFIHPIILYTGMF